MHAMKRLLTLCLGIGLAGTLGFAVPSQAADHLATAAAAGGLTDGVSQPYLNGLNNPGRGDEEVPGQGSPLSGNDHGTPATDTANSGQVKTNPAFASGKSAPSSHSVH
jgi:hypothetical protein